MKLNPYDFPTLTLEELERLGEMAVAAGRELAGYAARPRLLAVCPECRDGKHGNCIGYALDSETDVVGACECLHPEIA